MTAEEVAQRYDAKRSGSGWKAFCPAHDDKRPSLWISEGRVRVLVTCWAGCELDAVLSAKGLTKRDLFPESAHRQSKNGEVQRVPAPKVAGFDWRKCVAAFTDKHVEQIAKWRGFSPDFVRELRDGGHIGIFNGLVAFPVHNGKNIVGCHYRVKGSDNWFYFPRGTNATPLTFGELIPGERVNVFESTWDGLAYMDKSGERDGIIITRGAGNGALVAGLIAEGATAYLWTQNDEPDPKTGKRPGEDIWQKTVCAHTPKNCAIRRVNIPAHDLNDWTRDGGATDRDLLDAITSAETLREPSDESKSEDEAIRRLAEMSLLEYERVRKDEATKLGCRPSILDSLVNAKRLLNRPPSETDNLQGTEVKLADVEPWPDPVNGAKILDEIAQRFAQHIVLPDGAAIVLPLWCAHTHLFKVFEHSPRAIVSVPMHQCGKTITRNLSACFCNRALKAENLATAVLYRLVEAQWPTILADEFGGWLGQNEELQKLLNSGHERGGVVLRCVGDNHEVRAFAAFAPIMLCGIGALPVELHDRAIVIRLKRAKRAEVQKRFDSRRLEYEHELNRKLAHWCADNRAAIEACEPRLPERSYGRDADNWRPLFAIAEIAGGDWPQKCADAYAKLTSNEDEVAESLRMMLLADIREIFKTERMFSKDLVAALAELKERPWPEVCRGKLITERWLARNLAAFNIRPKLLRIGDSDPARGYEKTDFEDAFARYLS